MKIHGAILERVAAPRPYADSRPIRVSELALDPPRSGEVLIRVEAAGLCHSDLSVVDGNRPRPMPMLLGHEAAGLVDAVGPGVDGLAVGDRVVVTFLPRCGTCEGCLTGGIRPCVAGSAANTAGELLGGGRRLWHQGSPVHHHLGVSGFASHAVVDARSLVRVDPDVPAEVAALLGCAVLTGGGAVLNVARPAPGDRLIVVGLGGVGMAAVLTALALDGVEVVAVDPVHDKLTAAADLGAHRVATPDELDTAGLRGKWVIEAAGSARALESAISLTEPGGSTITVGLPAPDARVSLAPTVLVTEGRRLIGSYLGSAVPARDIPVFVELWRAGRLPVEKLITARIGLDEINRGMDDLAQAVGIRQLIVFGEDQ